MAPVRSPPALTVARLRRAMFAPDGGGGGGGGGFVQEDAVISNSARTAAKLAPICNCATCEGDDHDEPVADP